MDIESRETQVVDCSQLRQVNGVCFKGSAEKQVVKVTDGQLVMAAKIFIKEDVDGNIIDKVERAKEEFEAYRLLRHSILERFIPEQYFLLTETDGGIIGLAVEWIDGETVRDLWPQKPLTFQVVDELEQVFLSFVDKDVKPDTDMLSPHNIIMAANSSKPRIYFAECRVLKEEWEIENYPLLVKIATQNLKDHIADS